MHLLSGTTAEMRLSGKRWQSARALHTTPAQQSSVHPRRRTSMLRTDAPSCRPPAIISRAAAAGSVVTADVKDGLDVVKSDPQLAQHTKHLTYRYQQYLDIRKRIEATEGSLANFAKGYKKFGFNREGGATVYREWAPAARAAQVIGDFNGWRGQDMQKDEWGVWSITLPDDAEGRPAVPHGSRVKVKLQAPGGWWIDRLPAWIPWATIPPGVMGAKFDGIHWDPPAAERHQWQHARPTNTPAGHAALRIYEAHVGMSGEEPRVTSYTEFKDKVLPRIKAAGYNAIQLMAIQEHAYYASFGYHVTNPFAVSSRSGNPEELKALVDEAHRLGILVLLDVVHSHISKNQEDGLAGFDFGQSADMSYFETGERGYHKLWDSRCFNYSNWEVLRYLLSNLRWWLDEFQFDGFRFDGVTSMLYNHHGINTSFSGNYAEYFGLSTNVNAVVYLMLANELIHTLLPKGISIAEDVSGMPTLGLPVSEGGVGFDYRLGMGIPDMWIKLIKETRDEHWSMLGLVSSLCNRRYTERTIGYVESHDQALVGDQTMAFRLMGPQMYSGMSTMGGPNMVVERGVALHKMIRTITMALGGEGFLAFMGNEFGHPDWIDFPRDGNNWSYAYCRRQWSLSDAPHLRYSQLLAWDKAMMALDDEYGFMASMNQTVTRMDEGQKVLIAERGPLVFVFNFSPSNSYEGLRIPVPRPGKWQVACDSDASEFGGFGRLGRGAEYFSEPVAAAQDRPQSIQVLSPSRTVVAYAIVPE